MKFDVQSLLAILTPLNLPLIILINGEIIEDYSNDRPLPSYLILGFAENQKPIHAVVAIDVDEQIIWVITVYSPSLREWEDGYKRRKTI